MNFLTEIRWSPYLVGAGIGILSWFTFLLSKKPIGCSTAFARTSGLIAKIFSPRKVENNTYYREVTPMIDWEWMLVLGIIIGSLVSALLSGDFHWQWVPAVWASAFGTDPVTRVTVALIGGLFLGFGARWTGGCTSGHGISGTLQLAVSSWISAICFFIGGIAAAFCIFHVFA